LGMKVEARAFYTEVAEKFPKSSWAKQAKQRLQALK
jgi:TolA-binding protein